MGFLDRFKKKKAVETDIASLPEDTHDHSPVQENDPYKWEVAHRRLAWMFRLSIFVIVSLACVTVAAIDAIVSLADSFEPKIALVRVYGKDDKLYRVDVIDEDMDGFDLLMESKAKDYVRMMLEIDSVSQDQRFQEAFRMTDTDYYKKFRKDRIDSGEVKGMIDSGGTRSITVNSIYLMEKKGRVYKFAVEFTQTDKYIGQKPKAKEARAYLTMTTRPHEVTEKDKDMNPLGITVLDMSLKEKANS